MLADYTRGWAYLGLGGDMEQFQRHLGVNVANLPAADAHRDLKSFYGEGKAWTLWDDKEAWRMRETAEGNFYQDLLRK